MLLQIHTELLMNIERIITVRKERYSRQTDVGINSDWRHK